MVKRRTIIVSVLLVLLAAGALAFAGCRHGSPEDRFERLRGYLTDSLDLSEDQAAIITDLGEEVADFRRRMKEGRQNRMDNLLAQVTADTLDEELIYDLVAAHRARMDEIVPVVVTRLAEFHATLSVEQKERLAQKLEDLHRLHRYFH